ncbi:hypothetical protein Pcinc_018660 [Petrolisthes cinctipes]|uniref:Trans-1,2-dihydrobenzene-1,2-diol dehydrogenase n=1 Tax=Petrolisthes cinctipes TaxID=88211 RepID=A0AAE1KNJ6_PETCI|nr:hypothetical protein Pcinc_018660 [Petrolisthes cinctipes]
MATCWGVVGCGMISADFVTALKAVKEEHRVVAVAARSLTRAHEFARIHVVEKSYGSYEELAKDEEIEVVYVGVINSEHLRVASTMIDAGKNVLCEKPLCVNYRETELLVKRAWEKKVFLMEGVWTRHFPVYQEMIKRLEAGEVGEVVQVLSSKGHPMQSVPRVWSNELGGGATLDLGIYTIQFASLVMHREAPHKIVASGSCHDDGVDENLGVTLVYSEKRVATLSSSMRCLLPNEDYIIGTKGTIRIPCMANTPQVLESPSGKFECPIPNYGQKFNYPNSQGLMYEAMEVRRCLKEGLKECPRMPLEESLLLARIMEEIRVQVGVRIHHQDD